MRKKRVRIPVYLDEDVKAKFEQVCSAKALMMSRVIEKMVLRFLIEQEVAASPSDLPKDQ